ncbi:hypothetical protein H0E87_026787 [Populus deltoides]|uniref:non-specific serine/threonine protein kinase n=1 Tax=Populus deltoides TaxID=3696 RepID=A0A8T2WWL1_POPDE|nr:hypothetical protein H0E87_026787 [Populus deltoides]
MENKGNVLMERYDFGRLLGQGNFAKVYYGRNLKTGQSVAIKVIDKEKVLKVGLMDQIKREISVMKLVKHPNVLQLYEVMATKNKIYFVIEYAKGGELFNKRCGKPENLLLDENGGLKVSDFGLSAAAESRRQDGLLHTTCGTPAYWLLKLFIGKAMTGPKLTYDLVGLLSRMLDPNPKTRISITKIMENSWFRKGFDSNAVTIKNEVTGLDPLAADVTFDSCENDSAPAEAKKELSQPTSLNAFDIISLSSGFDLSGLLLKLKVKKKDGGLLKLEGSEKGRKGVLSIDTEIFEFTPSFHLVKVKSSSGDTLEYLQILENGIRPALKDIVWAWQGE